MTAVVAINEGGVVYVGADSAGINTETLHLVVRRDDKVFINDKYIVGFSGSYRAGQLLHYSFNPPEKPNGMTDIEFMSTVFVDDVRECFKAGGFLVNQAGRESGGKFIVGFNGQIYVVDSDFQVGVPVDDFASVGCGADLCLGSLCSTKGRPAKERIHLALEAAERYSAGVRRPFNIRSL